MQIIEAVTAEEVVDHLYNSIEGWSDEQGNYWSIVETQDNGFFFHVESDDGSHQRIFKFNCVEVWDE